MPLAEECLKICFYIKRRCMLENATEFFGEIFRSLYAMSQKTRAIRPKPPASFMPITLCEIAPVNRNSLFRLSIQIPERNVQMQVQQSSYQVQMWSLYWNFKCSDASQSKTGSPCIKANQLPQHHNSLFPKQISGQYSQQQFLQFVPYDQVQYHRCSGW